MKIGSSGNFQKIALSWCAITAAGVYGFVLSKRSIDKQRYEHMKFRERIKQSNAGDYPATPRFASKLDS